MTIATSSSSSSVLLSSITRRYLCSSFSLTSKILSSTKKLEEKFVRSTCSSTASKSVRSFISLSANNANDHLSLSSSSSSSYPHSSTLLIPNLQMSMHTQTHLQLQQVRYLGRKAGRMGQHIKNLNEIAHRDEHEKAKAKRNKGKKGKRAAAGGGGGNDDDKPASANYNNNPTDIPTIQEDETETIFDNGNDEDDDDDLSLPSKDEVKNRMMKVVTAMEDSFRAIRGAETTPELFENVQIKAYGSTTPLSSVAQVIIDSPTRASITCFDPEVTPAVRDGIRDNMPGMNFNPQIEEGVVIVPIPRVSAETRKAIVKQLGKTAEETRQRIRRIRRGAQDVVKKGKDGKLEGVSEDDAFRAGKDIDAATEESISALNRIVDEKQASVMNI
mmetsp:Transcript_9719/g.14457  ORF Transcript_9719/g.14457 Transcript_9719/m.14457 type:complete len:387 (-) Transcript_9719:37-1197(-)